MIEEISADITAYKKAYQRQLYVVYDLGVIRDEAEFKRDIEMVEGVKVVIVKHWQVTMSYYRLLVNLWIISKEIFRD